MIATLTPNPSVDRTLEIAELRRGAVLRATGVRVDPGGKGVNVSRALAAHGVKTVAVMPCGGAEGEQLAGLLAAESIEPSMVAIGAPVRANITVAEPDGTVTKLNEPGPALDTRAVGALLDATVAVGQDADWVACCGSLSPGTPPELYARLVHRMREVQARVAVDSSGVALAEAAEARPDLLKPNHEELAELVGQDLPTLGAVVKAAYALRERGVGAVLVSLGAQGAVLVDDQGAVLADTPPITVRSTVGAGDALLAGFLAAGGAGRDALVAAVAWGAAAASLPGSRMPAPDDVHPEAVRLHDPVPTDRPLGA